MVTVEKPNKDELLKIAKDIVFLLEEPNFNPELLAWQLLYQQKINAFLAFYGKE